MIRNVDAGSIKSLLVVGSQPFFIVILDTLLPRDYVASDEH